MVHPVKAGLKRLKPCPQGRTWVGQLGYHSPITQVFCRLGDAEKERRASMWHSGLLIFLLCFSQSWSFALNSPCGSSARERRDLCSHWNSLQNSSCQNHQPDALLHLPRGRKEWETQQGQCHTNRCPSTLKEACAVGKKCSPPNTRLRKPALLMENAVSKLWLVW